MNDRSVFHLMSDLTRQEGVSCVLIGGFAVNHYKVTRQTADVDFMITQQDLDKISGLLENAGYKKISRQQETFVQFQSIRLSLLDVDFMIVEKETLEKIIKEGEAFKISGKSFIVPSVLHLIALKLHSIRHNPKVRMMKDFPDIVNLIRSNEIRVKDREFKEMCRKYGTAEIYKSILDAVL